MKKTVSSLLAITGLLFPFIATADSGDTAITIYSKAQPGAVDPGLYRPVAGQGTYNGTNIPGYAVVRQVRNINIEGGESVVKFDDVAALIDPTTVQFKSLTDPQGTKVAEQNYQFDLVSQQKLFEKYIGKKIAVEKQIGDKTETVEGTLLSTEGGLTLKADDGSIKAINSFSSVNFSELPGGLITKPTLMWNVITDKPGEQKTEVSYETKGITWWADYNLIYNEGKDANSGTVDFNSWISIINQTGASFNQAKLKLIAGDVEHTDSEANNNGGVVPRFAMLAARAMPPKFDEKSFFEYHLYTLNHPVDLSDNSTKQLELIPAASAIPAEKLLVYNASGSQFFENGNLLIDGTFIPNNADAKVAVFLKIKNTVENGLGIPLPAGRIRVNQRDSDGSLEFIGENVIDHTPRNENLMIKLGNAFDVVGERKQLSYNSDEKKRTATEEIQIKIRNQKKQAASVKVLENMYRTEGFEILESSDKYTKESAHQISYTVNVEPEKEKIIKYKVRYNW